jgi:hypothetical protein
MNPILIFSSAISVLATTAVATTSVDPCLGYCDATGACASGVQSSYCKYWQNPPTCFGLYLLPNAVSTYCYEPNDTSCNDAQLQPITCTVYAAGASAATVPTAAPTVPATTESLATVVTSLGTTAASTGTEAVTTTAATTAAATTTGVETTGALI